MNSIPANPSAARAGRYVRQLTGNRAFLPAPLPPNPPIRLAGELDVRPIARQLPSDPIALEPTPNTEESIEPEEPEAAETE